MPGIRRSAGLIGLLILAAGLLVFWWPADEARGITLRVTKTDDTADGVCDSDCSLREAIAAAISGDSIEIPSGTYTLIRRMELVIDKDLTLTGAGPPGTRLSRLRM